MVLAIAACTLLYISVRLVLPLLIINLRWDERLANLYARMPRTIPHPKIYTVAQSPPLTKSKSRTKK